MYLSCIIESTVLFIILEAHHWLLHLVDGKLYLRISKQESETLYHGLANLYVLYSNGYHIYFFTINILETCNLFLETVSWNIYRAIYTTKYHESRLLIVHWIQYTAIFFDGEIKEILQYTVNHQIE